jgi:hypothetical protein
VNVVIHAVRQASEIEYSLSTRGGRTNGSSVSQSLLMLLCRSVYTYAQLAVPAVSTYSTGGYACANDKTSNRALSRSLANCSTLKHRVHRRDF